MSNKNGVLTMQAHYAARYGDVVGRHVAEEDILPLLTWADWELLQELHKCRESAGGQAADKPLLNKDAIIADLRDQIGDWEVKCKQLESRIESQQQTISSINCENARLSKSLQQYRAAYFADTTPAPQLGGGRGISVGAGGGAASIRELCKTRDALTNFSGGIGASDLTGGPTHDQPI